MSNDQRKRNRAWIEEYKRTHPCIRCGEDHPSCIEFHHRDERQKRETISALVNGGAAIARIKAELAQLLTNAGHPPKVLTASCVVGTEKATALFEAAYDEHGQRLAVVLKSAGGVSH